MVVYVCARSLLKALHRLCYLISLTIPRGNCCHYLCFTANKLRFLQTKILSQEQIMIGTWGSST